MNCPCCSGKSYEDCCKPYHTGEKHAPTAEALMRSRFSAFAIPNGEYLIQTTSPSKPSMNKVEFKAFYTDEDGKQQVHHELSQFKMIQNRWFYVSGEFLD